MKLTGAQVLSNNQLNNYNDLNALQSIKNAENVEKDQRLEAVAKQFESIFVSMMIKSMRDANKVFSEGNMLQSNQTDFYQDMFDSQLAVSMSTGQGIGLADVIKRQLSPTQGLSRSDNISMEAAPEGLALDLEKTQGNVPGLSMAGYDRRAFPAREQLERVIATIEKIEQRSQENSDIALQPTIKSIDANKSLDFSSPEAYIESLYPFAKSVEEKTGVDARVMLAQSALETGWGKRQILNPDGSPSHNLFGIKANNGWQGERSEILTTEYREGRPMKERAEFRAYSSYEDSFDDYASFLQGNERYQPALALKDDPYAFAHALQDSGYATDPAYGDKINSILDRYLKFDETEVR